MSFDPDSQPVTAARSKLKQDTASATRKLYEKVERVR